VRTTTRAEETISEQAIVQCCIAGNVTQLRRWARLGVRVVSAIPLCAMAQLGNVDMLRIVREPSPRLKGVPPFSPAHTHTHTHTHTHKPL
jgi:hypothetical protein